MSRIKFPKKIPLQMESYAQFFSLHSRIYFQMMYTDTRSARARVQHLHDRDFLDHSQRSHNLPRKINTKKKGGVNLWQQRKKQRKQLKRNEHSHFFEAEKSSHHACREDFLFQINFICIEPSFSFGLRMETTPKTPS